MENIQPKGGMVLRAMPLSVNIEPKGGMMPAAARLQMELDHTLLALADPTRRAILKRLSQGESRVTQLAQPFNMSLNAVSKHIRMLERAKLVKRRKSGREHFLSFNPKPLDLAAAWIDEHRELWKARLDALDQMLQAEEKSSIKKTKRKGKSP